MHGTMSFKKKKEIFRSSGMLRNVEWQLVTDFSRHFISTMEPTGCRKTSVT